MMIMKVTRLDLLMEVSFNVYLHDRYEITTVLGMCNGVVHL